MKRLDLASADPHLLLGLANTALRNGAEDPADFAARHDAPEALLHDRLREIGYTYMPDRRQFRPVPAQPADPA
jgi:hypothetical protein